jgi:5-methylcytosine-specific restriction endonuclease McrA
MAKKNNKKALKRKIKIPVALREQVWIRCMGEVFKAKCSTIWCSNTITVFDFQSGHNIPESRGGQTTIENLVPLCSRCNQSMGNNYTFDEWNAKFKKKKISIWNKINRYFLCF